MPFYSELPGFPALQIQHADPTVFFNRACGDKLLKTLIMLSSYILEKGRLQTRKRATLCAESIKYRYECTEEEKAWFTQDNRP